MDDKELFNFGILNGRLKSIKQCETPCAFSVHAKNVKEEEEENNELCYLGHTQKRNNNNNNNNMRFTFLSLFGDLVLFISSI